MTFAALPVPSRQFYSPALLLGHRYIFDGEKEVLLHAGGGAHWGGMAARSSYRAPLDYRAWPRRQGNRQTRCTASLHPSPLPTAGQPDTTGGIAGQP
eukprot:2274295-Pyramimonas_sp.AAC.1